MNEKSSNLIKRLLCFAIGVPVLFFLAVKGSFMSYLPLVVIMLFFIVGSTIELIHMIEPKAKLLRKIQIVLLATCPSLLIYITELVWNDGTSIEKWLTPLFISVMIGFLLSAFPLVFAKTKEKIDGSIKESALNCFYLFYPGIISSTLISLLCLDRNAGLYLIWFMMTVFSNDSFAWLFGVTLGKHKNLFIVSPNKSLEGFIAGMAGSIVSPFIARLFLPDLIGVPVINLIIFGTICGIAVVTGDLFESSIKRAANVKDSGHVIPGRGGILDSFDSILFTAPVFLAGLYIFIF